ncbi:MAG: hypothetical protein AAF288_03265 [Planctomycetota bacterium]
MNQNEPDDPNAPNAPDNPAVEAQPLDSLLLELLENRDDLPALARKLGLSLSELSSWIATPEHAGAVQGLCALADAKARLRLGVYRLFAVDHLAQQAFGPADDEGAPRSDETRRRAAVELLKARLDWADPAPAHRAGHDDTPWEDAFARLAQAQRRAAEHAEPPSPQVPPSNTPAA